MAAEKVAAIPVGAVGNNGAGMRNKSGFRPGRFIVLQNLNAKNRHFWWGSTFLVEPG